MTRHVDDVIRARHDIKIPVFILISRITRLVIAFEMLKIGFAEAGFGIPQRRQGCRRQGQFNRNRAQFARRQFMPALIQNLHIIPGHWHRGAADFDRQFFNTQWVATNGPTRFGLPPMVNHGHAKFCLRPLDCVRVGTLTRQEQRFKARDVIFSNKAAFWVFALDRAKGRWGGKQAFNFMLINHAPERACIRRANRFAFKDDCGAAKGQRRVTNIGMPHDPTHIRGGPKHLAGVHVVEIAH